MYIKFDSNLVSYLLSAYVYMDEEFTLKLIMKWIDLHFDIYKS